MGCGAGISEGLLDTGDVRCDRLEVARAHGRLGTDKPLLMVVLVQSEQTLATCYSASGPGTKLNTKFTSVNSHCGVCGGPCSLRGQDRYARSAHITNGSPCMAN